ncbi:testis specific 10, isoform CRA_e [Rattus norvegicus]|uniref:Testis specific 10, isoform CRA_e n=1 Tax=Rattus norvegicus TaxID=10116 RepID=A6INH7_RAT|nr:testis specific 10, isoform CRA_e [Rattus norvegicus]
MYANEMHMVLSIHTVIVSVKSAYFTTEHCFVNCPE